MQRLFIFSPSVKIVVEGLLRYLNKVIAALKEDAANAWLAKYVAHDVYKSQDAGGKRPVCPPSKVIKELSPYIPKSPVKLFRGLSFFSDFEKNQPRLGSTYQYIDKQCSSWTTNLGTAIKFAKTRELGFVIYAVIDPASIIVDIDMWREKHEGSDLKWAEHEVIVKPIDMKTKVAFIHSTSGNISKTASGF